MKQAIYIFSMYIGVVTFFTLSIFPADDGNQPFSLLTGDAGHRCDHFRGKQERKKQAIRQTFKRF